MMDTMNAYCLMKSLSIGIVEWCWKVGMGMGMGMEGNGSERCILYVYVWMCMCVCNGVAPMVVNVADYGKNGWIVTVLSHDIIF